MTIASTELFRSAGGQRLHIRECPHILGKVILTASAADLETREVCAWCLAELSDEGRTYFDDIESALLEMGAARGVIAELARHLRTVEHDTVFVPFSRSYVAVALDGRAVAWAGRTYVAFRGRPPVLLAGYVPGGGAGTTVAQVWGEVCPRCFVQRSRSGACVCY